MSKNPILVMLLRKKAQQAKQLKENKFHGNDGHTDKVNSKGFVKSCFAKKSGRGN